MDIDRLLVMGEIIEKDDGSTEVRYPSQTEVAARFNTTQTVVSKYMREHNCLERREQAKVRQAIRIEEKIIERRAEGTAISKEEVIELIDEAIIKFRDNLRERRVRADSTADLNTLVRLKEYIQGGADSRQEIQGALSLEAIQGRYQSFAGREAESDTVEADGIEVREPTIVEDFTDQDTEETTGLLLPQTLETQETGGHSLEAESPPPAPRPKAEPTPSPFEAPEQDTFDDEDEFSPL
jgi:predicted transcriptional regulator